MEADMIVAIGRELILTGILLAAPAVAVSLAVGLSISIFQAVTSIQEQTLTFAPRIVAVGAALLLALPWSLRVISNFAMRMIVLMSEAAQ